MEETKKQKWLGRMEEIKNKSGWKEELVKWYQPHMINFYLVFMLSVIYFISCNKILQVYVVTPVENLIVVSFMAILIIVNISMWNNCIIRQTVEDLKLELKRIK